MSARGWKLQLADASILIIEWWYLDHSLKLICKLLLCLNLFEFKFKIVYNSNFNAQQKVSYTRNCKGLVRRAAFASKSEVLG
ncbi:hypothetical protein CSV77_15205 [Sporosarcina sp. P16b]|nr:hypothetical protein CSV77_15205 [Sporosarcina sp. P16b]